MATKSRFPEIPVYAQMVIGTTWSGWAWEEMEGVHRFKLCYRLQHNEIFAYRTFNSWDQVEQFCDGLEGDTDEFIRN